MDIDTYIHRLSEALAARDFYESTVIHEIYTSENIASAIIAIFIAMTENGKPHVCGGSGLFLGLFSGFIAFTFSFFFNYNPPYLLIQLFEEPKT